MTAIDHRTVATEHIVDALKISGVQLSPCGQRVVYSTEPIGKKSDDKLSSLWVAEVAKARSSRMVTAGTWNDRMPRWSPDGKCLAFLSDRAGNDTCAIYLLPLLEGGEARPLTNKMLKRSIASFKWSPDGKSIAFTSADEKSEEQLAKEKAKRDDKVYGSNVEYNRLRIVDVATSEVRVLVGREAHITSFDFSPDGNDIAYVTQPRPGYEYAMAKGMKFERVSIRTGETETITTFPTEVVHDLIWCGDEVYFIGNADAHKSCSAKALFQLDLAEGKWSKQSYGQEDCIGDFGRIKGVEGISVTVLSKLSEQVQVLGEGTLYAGDHEISAWDVHRDQSGVYTTAFVKSGFLTPPEMFVVSGSGAPPVQLSSHGLPSIISCSAGEVHKIECKTPPTGDSPVFDLHSFLITPHSSSGDSAPYPTAVFIHGGPYFNQTESFEAPHRPWAASVLASGKYAVLLPNYRGGAGQGQAFATAVHGKAGLVDYDDMLAVVDEGIHRGLIDPTRIVVGGWSWGGMMSYLAAVRNGRDSHDNDKGWRFKAAICGAGACDGDLSAMVSDIATSRHILMGSVPWASEPNDVRARAGSAIWEIKKAVAEKRLPPVLLLHGEDDPRVPAVQAKAFNRACEHYDVACEMVLYPREGHTIVERMHLVDMLERLNAFLDIHLA